MKKTLLKKLLFVSVVTLSVSSWAQTQIKVTGPKATAIMQAFIYTLADFPFEGALVKNVQCKASECSYEFNNQAAFSGGTMIGAKELMAVVSKCKGSSASTLECKSKPASNSNLKYSCIVTCEKE